MTFEDHIDKMMAKTKRNFGYFRSFTHKIFGESAERNLTIYKSHIRPLLEYGSPVWGNASKTQLDKLERVQSWCLSRILGISRRSDREDVRKYCDLQSLEERREYTLLKYWKKKTEQKDLFFQENISSAKPLRGGSTINRRIKKIKDTILSHDRNKKKRTIHDYNICELKAILKSTASKEWDSKVLQNEHAKLFRRIIKK
jgi:hypothetical protein